MHGRSGDILKAQEVVEAIGPEDLTREEQLLLIDSAKRLYDEDRVEADYWVLEALEGRAQFWRFDDGLAITKITHDAGHRYMVMCGFMGEGVIWKLADVYRALKVWGKVKGCTRIVTQPADPRITAYGLRIGGGIRKVELLMEDI